MKIKWPIAIVAALALVAGGLTAGFWLPHLVHFASDNDKKIEALKNFIELIGTLLGAGLVVIKWLFGKKDGESPGRTITQDARAGRDVIQAGGNVQSRHAERDYIEQQIIQQAAPLVAAPQFTPLDSLPAPPADFTGRQDELGDLRRGIEEGSVRGAGFHGSGGVGKTTLALKLAEQVKSDFPDAQLYLNLKGVSATPLNTADAMAYVIRAFRPGEKLPEGSEELKAIYLSVLHDKRAILLMDNAFDRSHVEALTPPLSCLILVTSRTRFALPGFREIYLTTLPRPEAEELLIKMEPRIDGEAGRIADLCGCLPLALRLAGRALAERPDLEPSDYARRLVKERLKVLADGEASIQVSYALLGATLQKQWRALGVFPDTFDTPAAAALWDGVILSEAKDPGIAAPEDVLGDLLKYSMLDWNSTAKRYRLHDLMRDFARARLQESGEQDEAARRHAAYYVNVLAQADDLYLKGGDSIKPGLALFDLEWGNIQAGQAWAAVHSGQDDEAARLCSRYPVAGAYCLELRLHPQEDIRWGEAALAAARRLKDRSREGVHLGNLGLAYDSLGEYRRAIEYHEQQLRITRELGDRLGEGTALGNLGVAYDSLGEYRRAIEYYEQDLTIAREIGDRRGEGAAHGGLGNAYYSLGDHRRAIEYYGQYLTIAREIGDRRGEGNALGSLGIAYDSLGKYRRAIEYHEQYLAIAREIGDRSGEGQALGNLGLAYHSLGEYHRAIEYQEQRLVIAREIGDRLGEGNALWNMSLTLDKLGERAKAIENAEAAFKIYEQIEAPYAERVRKRLEEWKGIG